jgi:protein O-mannosyl-transferase
LLTFLVFLAALDNGFVDWDDDKTITENPHFRGLGWNQLRWMFTTFHTGHYQPLSWITLGFDYLVWGTDPIGYHLTSLALHAANAVLFYFICRRLFLIVFARAAERQGLAVCLAAGLAALLFAVHPLRVESVAWATERRDVLSGLFFLACIALYLRAHQSPGATRPRWLTAAVVAHALSLSAKATAITLPVVLLLIDVYPLRRMPGRLSAWLTAPARSVLREKLPFLFLAVLFAVIALAAQHDTGALRPIQQYFFSYRLAQAFYGMAFYLWKSLLPVGLSPLYEVPFDFDASMPLFLLSGAAAAFVTVAFYLLRRRWPALLASWIYYIVVVAPVLGIAQSGPQLVADRYSYLSCLSWAVLAGGVFFIAWKRPEQSERGWPVPVVAGALAAGVIGILAVMTWNQIGVWRDTTTLWQHVLRVAPQTSIAHYNLGRSYESKGDLAQARESYLQALAINPTHTDARYNLARLLAKSGNQSEAIAHYREVLKFKPNDAEARNNLGLLLARKGEIEASLKEFQKAIESDPNYPQAFFNMGRVLAHQGDLGNAKLKYQEALKLSPEQAEIHFGMATVLTAQGDWTAAIEYLRQAVILKPEFAEAHAALARILAAQGRNDEAEQHYREALRLLRDQPTTAGEAKGSK